MGKFYEKDRKPYYSPGEDLEYEIKTSNDLGLEIKVESNPQELLPGFYYNLGIVTKKLTISRLQSLSKTHVETYSGEFVIGVKGSVTFPSQVKWVGGTPNFSEEGALYQFSIVNGIGTYNKV